ncbi:HD-GYP domain-containing protein [Desulfofalx alkaliphila]|uniref:HD-GYP domain-containing protein n=1 Tax=Desulfofalx alkaliphila TaxID=105483 RepID=UPI00068B8A86|nr:HD domain-containing phosphohydrolase [Desulfofalx alkaliphila]
MSYNQLSILINEIGIKKMSVNPWAPLSKRIYKSRLHEININELLFRAVQKTSVDHRLVELFPRPVLMLDNEGGIVKANDSALAWMGKEFPDVEGEFIGDLLFDRRRKIQKNQFLSPVIEAIVKNKECFLEKCYVSTAAITNPIPVELSTKVIRINGIPHTAVVIYAEFATSSFDQDIQRMFSEIFADSPEVLTNLSKYIIGPDSYTCGHCKQVAEYAALIGVEVGLSNQELEYLYYACMLHDIGKLAVAPEVLHKKTCELTPDELQAIQIHPDAGADILEEFSFFKDMAPYVRHHHERYDGTGYPAKLKGKEIPFLSRIMTIADAFDVMTSPHRKSYSLERAKEELVCNAGGQFDPYLVSIAVKLIDNGKLKPASYCETEN